jgi:hypothetical protein
MSIYETIKDVVSIAQKADNIDLMRQLLQLQNDIMQLTEENRSLRERLDIRGKLTFRENSYWDGNEGPFCSRCADAEGKLIRLHKPSSMHRPRCPSCGNVATDPNAAPPKPVAPRVSHWLER